MDMIEIKLTLPFLIVGSLFLMGIFAPLPVNAFENKTCLSCSTLSLISESQLSIFVGNFTLSGEFVSDVPIKSYFRITGVDVIETEECISCGDGSATIIVTAKNKGASAYGWLKP